MVEMDVFGAERTAASGADTGLAALLLNAAEQGIIATDLDGRIVVWNRFAEVMYGWTAAEVIGRSIIEVTPTLTTADQARSIMSALRRGDSWRGEFEVQRKDGSTFTAMVVNSPIIRGDELVGVVGLSIDVSERLASQAALRESEERFRTMADNLPLLIWQHDSAGRQEWVNATFCSFFGVSRHQMRAERWQMLTHPDDGRQYGRDFLAAVAERRPFHGEVRVRHADGQWRWLESWGSPRIGPDGVFLGYVGTSADVTERKLAQLTLNAAAAINAFRTRLADVLESLTDPAQIAAGAARTLARHLRAGRVRYLEIDEHVEYATVLAEHCPDLPGLRTRHPLDDYGADRMTAFRAGQPVVVDAAGPESPAGFGAGAYVVVPVVRQNRPVAAVAVHDLEPRSWVPDDLTLITDAAERTWAAIRKAAEEQARHDRHARAQLVVDVLSTLERHHTVAAQVQALTDVLVPRVADYATVEAPGEDDFLLALTHRDHEKAQILRRLRTEHRLGAGQPDSLHAAAAGTAQLLSIAPDMIAEYARYSPDATQLLARLGTRSHLAVPLALSDAKSGALMIGLSEPGRAPYRPDDLAFFEDLARRIGVVLMSAHIRQREHDIAVRLQRSMLPDRVESHPHLGIEARYRAGDELLEVGGDWYDTFAWPDGRIGVVIGDVAGHTMDAAIIMGRLRAVTAAFVPHTPADPAAVLDALEEYACGPSGAELVSAVCVIIDPRSGVLTYSSAGHPPPLVLAPGRPPQRLEHARAPAIYRYHDDRDTRRRPRAEITLEPGALIVMYSDGLIERRRTTLTAGIARLETVAAGLTARTLPAVADGIVARMTDDSPTDDDIVLVCLRYTPPGQDTGSPRSADPRDGEPHPHPG
ncbi:hypothetical protein GCM10020358_80340 [Amorphoplanes nipponensis]|uniref:PAS domain S-box-containing protein n=1 Tax=Actinoplanes nipponensis TaxID=135950 RepID=A0A919JDF0_9ACTN|nr:PAS domain S-box protein [Actinoplanes nipponensis]GIE47325.1 hypothetical protein Ani05nite_08590 [Actinoplanes nipponensis]